MRERIRYSPPSPKRSWNHPRNTHGQRFYNGDFIRVSRTWLLSHGSKLNDHNNNTRISTIEEQKMHGFGQMFVFLFEVVFIFS